jgi:ribosomal protein L37AE/L43A/vacuolar-type H+-ATPase subunit H
MRQRKRDWPILVYRYWLSPDWQNPNVLPKAVWQEHFHMVELWNRLVELAQSNREKYRQISEEIGRLRNINERITIIKSNIALAKQQYKQRTQVAHKRNNEILTQLKEYMAEQQKLIKSLKSEAANVKKEYKHLIKPKIDALAAGFYKEVKRLCHQSPLYWANSEYIQKTFLISWQQSLRQPAHFRGPRPHNLQTSPVHFHHRFTNCGLPVDRVIIPPDEFHNGTRLNRVAISSPDLAKLNDTSLSQRQRKRIARTRCFFTVNGYRLPFKMILHRPIPPDAIVKMATLSRTFRADQPKWFLSLTVELPPDYYQIQHDGQRELACAIDLGYRRSEDTLRCGYLVDTGGVAEELLLPSKILQIHDYVRVLKQRQDNLLNEAKAIIKREMAEADPTVRKRDDLKSLLQNWHLAKQRRLKRILDILTANNILPELRDYLLQWSRKDRRLYREWANLLAKATAHRNWFYQNLAARLCAKYQHIILEEISLSRLARKGDWQNRNIPPIVNYYRTIASPSSLRTALERRAARTNTKIIVQKAAYTTQICHVCGALCDPSEPEELIWTCWHCGNSWDQDENASRNLLNSISQESLVQPVSMVNSMEN